jgi:hypothetical protein
MPDVEELLKEPPLPDFPLENDEEGFIEMVGYLFTVQLVSY